ncbi:MAG: CtsR family transcriptional regulator [Clostridia bacterium]
MNLSDIIEEYIHKIIEDEESVELKRCELAKYFNCVPSQINYVISTRFVPELGFYVESKRGGGGYIKITKADVTKKGYVSDIIQKIGSNMSQNVVDVYLNDFVRYNILDEKLAILVKVCASDKSLAKVEKSKRDEVRADIFKNIMFNLVNI